MLGNIWGSSKSQSGVLLSERMQPISFRSELTSLQKLLHESKTWKKELLGRVSKLHFSQMWWDVIWDVLLSELLYECLIHLVSSLPFSINSTPFEKWNVITDGCECTKLSGGGGGGGGNIWDFQLVKYLVWKFLHLNVN